MVDELFGTEPKAELMRNKEERISFVIRYRLPIILYKNQCVI